MADEIPVTAEITDPGLIAYFQQRLRRTAEVFGISPVCPTPLILMRRPEEPPERVPIPGSPAGCLVFIATDDHFSCARYELAHEATHEVLSHGTTTLDWVQEMFAEYIALRAVHELEESAPSEFAGEYRGYAEDREAEHRSSAIHLPLSVLRMANLELKYPSHTYARAFVTAEELVSAIGWDALRPLGSMFDRAHKHDISAWLDSLKPSVREVAQLILEA